MGAKSPNWTVKLGSRRWIDFFKRALQRVEEARIQAFNRTTRLISKSSNKPNGRSYDGASLQPVQSCCPKVVDNSIGPSSLTMSQFCAEFR
jgi:hypothetical protein